MYQSALMPSMIGHAQLRPTMKLEYNWVRDDAALEDKW